jgi:DNA-binding IclR family transcriptional regulator
VPTAAFHQDMVRAFLSADERRIVAELAGGPQPLKNLVARLHIKRSRCATLAGNLRDRGIVRVGDRGYELTPGPWAELAGAGVAPAAAV